MALSLLRPTQVTIGLDYVRAKMAITERQPPRERDLFMERHAVRVVLGPDAEPYIVDHHHWAYAWLKLGLDDAPVVIVRDYSHLPRERFEQKMRARGWLHPFDAQGRACPPARIPLRLDETVDDPYQSLAQFTRRAGAYRKSAQRCSSFVWADFLRERVPLHGGEPGLLSLALTEAIKVARSKAAAHLPGFIGSP